MNRTVSHVIETNWLRLMNQFPSCSAIICQIRTFWFGLLFSSFYWYLHVPSSSQFFLHLRFQTIHLPVSLIGSLTVLHHMNIGCRLRYLSALSQMEKKHPVVLSWVCVMKLCIGDRPGKRFELSKDWSSCKPLLEAIWSERGLLLLCVACRL